VIEIEIKPDWVEAAWKKSKAMGRIRHSITKGNGNFAGFLGEEIAKDYLGVESENTYDYDLIADGIKYDVKTKRCTSRPSTKYDCTIYAYNTKQKCDRYLFVRIGYVDKSWEELTGKAWILGYYEKEDFTKDARFLKKGSLDGFNKFKVMDDCYNMKICNLKQLNA
tara:strand:- start:1985 stop:2482 length:498 start_codon:yes stop_codon:yes gene_type:complete